MVDRTSGGDESTPRGEVLRRSTPTLKVSSDAAKIPVGIDGSLHKVKAPVTIRIDERALTVVLPADVVKRQLGEYVEPTDEALGHLSGVRGSSQDSNE